MSNQTAKRSTQSRSGTKVTPISHAQSWDSGKHQTVEHAEDTAYAAEAILGASPVVGLDAGQIRQAAQELLELFVKNMGKVTEHQVALVAEFGRIMIGRSTVVPDATDRRFHHPIWRKSMYYRRVMQAYLAWSDSLYGVLDEVESDKRTRARARFVLKQMLDAAAPTNNPLGQPGFVNSLFKTGGLSLITGLRNLIDDQINNQGMPRQVDERPFKVGRNLAVTEGQVVFRNAVCEIIQYRPLTEDVHEKPVLIIPPQINKYYVVDLARGKSLVRNLLDQGVQTFCISWRNPTRRHRDWGMETYVSAARDAVEAVQDITGADSVNLMAVCVGGITASILAGHLFAAGEEARVASLSLMVTTLDTQSESLLGLFAGKDSIEEAIEQSRKHGVLDGRAMSRNFAWSKANELVWSFVINNYLMGRQPPASDVLYWNNDVTRLPARYHEDLLRLFEKNPLTRAGGLSLMGTPIDLSRVDCPVYIVAGVSDHITPWSDCYRSCALFGGEVRFVLSASGHVHSVIHAPTDPASRYFADADLSLEALPWKRHATLHQGSWWQDWYAWAQPGLGELIEKPTSLGSAKFQPGDDAPGRYVHQR